MPNPDPLRAESAIERVLDQFGQEGADGDWYAILCAARSEYADLRAVAEAAERASQERQSYYRPEVNPFQASSLLRAEDALDAALARWRERRGG